MTTKQTFHPTKKLLIEEKDYKFSGLILTQVRKYLYDENDRLIEVISLDKNDNCLYTIKNDYNEKGQKFAELKISKNPEDNTEQFHLFDSENRIISTYGKLGSGRQYVHEFSYGKAGEQIVASMGTLAQGIDLYKLFENDLKKQQKPIGNIESIYQTNPQYVIDTLQLYYFNTVLYYETKMEHFQKLKISGNLMMPLSVIQHAVSYKENNGVYEFKFKSGFLGLASKAPFKLLFNEIIKVGFSAIDIDDMYEKFYSSKNPLLVNLSERFKDYDISVSKQLYEFIHRQECNPQKDWTFSELRTGNWNYNLLALNEKVWDTAFDKKYINEIFHEEKVDLDKIEEGNLKGDGHKRYIERIDTLIDDKLR
ncbi:hypothetical protein [Mucilaginibacter sp.]|uniref:hypothetical protein n=1 Tax=Mucilaginibacter sp. TaxID=1882438 RepID=UPI0035660BB3